jgi:hypothetical protein
MCQPPVPALARLGHDSEPFEAVARAIDLTVLLLAVKASAASGAASGARLTEPPAARGQALQCHGSPKGSARAPVILVHGTGSTPEESRFELGGRTRSNRASSIDACFITAAAPSAG